MAAGIYKSGQGYYTRWVSAVAYGLLVGMGALWLWDILESVRIADVEPIYVAGVGTLVFCAIGGGLIYYYIGLNRKVVDFMIATEGEMKKVNWSTRREVLGSTWVVIAMTFIIAVLIFALDYLVYAPIFRAAGVLETG